MGQQRQVIINKLGIFKLMIYKPFLSVKDTSVNMKSERRTMEPQTRNVKEITTQTETESLHY